MKKISVVITGRNDNYGDSLKERANHCINHLCDNFNEVIYVDYNTVDNITLTEAQGIKRNNLKTIVVNNHNINSYKNGKYANLKFHENLAKNIGIKRATNDWILSTNIDCIINDLSKLNVRDDTMYTCARRDVPKSIYLAAANTNLLAHQLYSESNNYLPLPDVVVNGIPVWDPGDIWSLVVGCGDFLFASKKVWETIRGFEEDFVKRTYSDSNVMKKAWLVAKIDKLTIPYFHLNHDQPSNPEINDRLACVNNFTKSTQTKDWGMRDIDLTIQ